MQETPQGKQYRLKKDIISKFRKGNLYGKRGEVVTEISKNGDMLIVENAEGFRFPVTQDNVNER